MLHDLERKAANNLHWWHVSANIEKILRAASRFTSGMTDLAPPNSRNVLLLAVIDVLSSCLKHHTFTLQDMSL